jgi:hypothetical protein
MKTRILLIILFLAFWGFKTSAQSSLPSGYVLPETTNPVQVHQAIPVANSPNTYTLSTYSKIWDFKTYFFIASSTSITISNVEYYLIWIPSGKNGVNFATNQWTISDNLQKISQSDWDKFLLISKTDFDNKIPHYPKLTHGLVLSAVTMPLKIHPSIDGKPVSLLNANFNAGAFIGYRLGIINNTVGATIGGFFGISAIDQNSANNSAITGTTTQSMTALDYGVGIVLDITKTVQLGFMIGSDQGTGDYSSTYIYQKKAWYALGINFNFLDFSHPVVGN